MGIPGIVGHAAENLEWVVVFPAVSDRPGDALAFRHEAVLARGFSGPSWLAPYECRGEFGTVRSTTRAGADRVAAEILSKLAVLTPRGPPSSPSAVAGGGGDMQVSITPIRDARILQILREEGEERFRSIVETAADSHEKDFDDLAT